jgi:hypothetical protein
MAELITVASGSSATFTVGEQQSVVLNNGRADVARLEATSGPLAGRTITARHNGRGVYGPFPAGGMVLYAVSGACGYELSGDRVSNLDGDGNTLSVDEVAAARAMIRAKKQRIGVMGDSIAAQNSDNASPAYDYNDNGWLTWAMCRLGWPWYWPLANNFAVAGTTTALIIENQMPSVLAEHALRPISRMFISCGTNDSNNGTTLAKTKEDFFRLFGTLLDAGIIPVHIGVLPRGNDGAMTNAKRQNLAMNEWMRWYESTRGGLEFVDLGLAIANNATAFGNALTAFTDGSFLHPISPGAFHMGKVLADYYRVRGVSPGMHFATQQADQYDATYNPTGIIFESPNPLLQGGVSAPTGMTTSGGSWAVGTRTLDNGQTKPVVNCTLTTSATHYLYDDSTGTGAWASEGINVGDWVYGQCEMLMTSVVGLNSCSLQLNESDGTTTRQARCLDSSTAMGVTTDTPLTLYTQTPPIQIQPYSGSGNVSMFLRQNIGTSGSGSGTVSIRGFEVRKWVGEV